MKFKNKSQKGMVLLVFIVLLLMLSLIGISSIITSTGEMKGAGNELRQTGSFYAAESGIEKAAAEISTSYETMGVPPNPLPSGSFNEGGYQYDFSTVDGGPAVQTMLSDGGFRGLFGFVKRFDISSTGIDNLRESSVKITMAMQDALIPIFQFAVFYQNDLEIAPGPNMTLGGRVHSNSDIYLQSNNNLYVDSYLTSAGDILHGRRDGSGQPVGSGDVFIMDRNSAYQNMKNTDGSWLDSQINDWVPNSLSRWGGRVEDSNHGITELNMPVVVDGPATDLIDRGGGNNDSFENKAGLKLIDGRAIYRHLDGSWQDVTAQLILDGAITVGEFYDGREGVDVNSLDLDIEKLDDSGYFPLNGIIYNSQQPVGGIITAMRLTNGVELPAALTVATDNPLYTVGNFNTTRKKPAALMADAITILSGNWRDIESRHGLGSRVASATQVNACFMTGNVETGVDGNGYSGGLENLPRFLEKWDGVEFSWRGSMVDLWYSRQATSAWSYGGYYTAPDRNWAFDPDLLDIANLPPGTPMVNVVLRSKWFQQVGESPTS
jgi:hypothetical protein